jgi:hypothetical protein
LLEGAPFDLSDFGTTWLLAGKLFDAGFNGVQYMPSRDWPSYSVVALWSEPGEGSSIVKSGASQPIQQSMLKTLAKKKVIEVLDEEALALEDPTQ